MCVCAYVCVCVYTHTHEFFGKIKQIFFSFLAKANNRESTKCLFIGDHKQL